MSHALKVLVPGVGTLVLVVALAGTATADSRPQAQPPEERLTKAKLDTDLGNYDEAARSLADLAASPTSPAPLRAEALVRLGTARQGAGDAKGSLEVFTRVFREHGDDEAAVRLLVHAVGAVIPGKDRWDAAWRRLQLGVDVTDPERPSAFVRWPTAPWAPRQLRDPEDAKVVRFVRPARPLYTGDRITLDFKDGDLGDTFRLFADISGLNVVVNPGVRGLATFRATKQPWDDLLDRLLSANGLAYQLKGPVLHIGRAEDLGPASQTFSGRPIDLDFNDVDLVQAFRDIAEKANKRPLPPGFQTQGGRLRVEVAPRVAGHVTLRLTQVPWDQAFDLLARLNGLRWKRETEEVVYAHPPLRRSSSVRPTDVLTVGLPEDF